MTFSFYCFSDGCRFDVAAVNFRGCSGELSNFPVGYHLGFTADLLHVVRDPSATRFSLFVPAVDPAWVAIDM